MNSFDRIPLNLIDQPIPANQLIDGHSGYPADVVRGDTIDSMKGACGSAARDFPSSLWIEPSQWKERARQNDEYKTWPINYIDRFTNQHPTHECTCHALSRCAEGARNKQRGIIFADGPKNGARYAESAKSSVWLSPLSIYAEANPRQWGGAGCTQVLNIATRRGFLPEKIQPREYGFRHALQGTAGQGNSNQSSGAWVSLSQFPSGWQETAKFFKPDEVIFTKTWEQVVCLILHGYLVEVGRNGHAIPYACWNVEQEVMTYIDSYSVLRYDSKNTVRGCANGAFAITSMTVSDDWNKPAD